MSTNRGKQFEHIIRECFERVPNVSIDRLPDQMNGYKVTSKNICDFIVYKKPYQYYIECKSVHGNTFPFSNITDKQWSGLLEKSKIEGVIAGIICWWVDRDITRFLSIGDLELDRQLGAKSVRFDTSYQKIFGKKKRVFFDYNMEEFFDEIESRYYSRYF